VEPREPDPTIHFVRPSRANMLQYARETYERGGIITFCWHQSNPVTKANAWDVTPALATLLPGGENNESYKKTLDSFAAFFKELWPMPVIFRPYHEHNGDWFWWGKGNADEKDFIALWRFTEEYLRDVKGVHNLIYAFSPDRSKIELATFDKDYLYGYPGDDYVDIFALDDYRDAAPRGDETTPTMDVRQQEFAKSLENVVKLADAHHKLAALTETGNEKLDIPHWYTNVLLKSLETNDYTRRIAWAQVWRNADAKVENVEHFYAPYPGHPSVPDFMEFYNSPFTMFEADLPDMYHETSE
jgi:mannan endo-1,4-beta-mannosidase